MQLWHTVPMDTSLTVIQPTETLNTSSRATVNHRALAAAWTDHLRAQAAAGMLAERTAETYTRNAGRWLDWLDARALGLPSPADVLMYVTDLRHAGLKPASVNACLDSVRGLYRWAETRNAYPAIARSVRGLSVRKDEPLECLTPEQVAGLLSHADGESLRALRDRAIVRVLFSTGLREDGLCNLNVADLDAGDAVLAYKGKGDRDKCRRTPPLGPTTLAAVRRYLQARADAEGVPLEGDAPMFAAVGNRAGGDRLTVRGVRGVVVGLMERAGHVRRGADGKIINPGVFSVHSLRRSAITAAFDAAGLDAAQTLAGHADPKTTRRAYARVEKGRVLRGLSGVLDLGGVA